MRPARRLCKSAMNAVAYLVYRLGLTNQAIIILESGSNAVQVHTSPPTSAPLASARFFF